MGIDNTKLLYDKCPVFLQNSSINCQMAHAGQTDQHLYALYIQCGWKRMVLSQVLFFSVKDVHVWLSLHIQHQVHYPSVSIHARTVLSANCLVVQEK